MPLPSQAPRQTTRLTPLTKGARRRRRRRVPWIGLTIAAVVVAIIAWRFWPGGDEASDTAVADAAEQMDAETTPPVLASTDLIATPPAAPPAAAPEPVPSRDLSEAAMEDAREVAEVTITDEREDLSQLPDLFDTPPPAPERHASAAPDRTPVPSDPAPQIKEPRGGWGWGERQVQSGFDLLAQNQPIEARRALSDALLSGDLDESVADRIRAELTELNDRLVFSPEVIPNDPFALSYTIHSGDLLSRVPKRMGLQIDWRLLQTINNISDPRRIREGQRIKVLTGPFHAIVEKRDYRMDVFMGDGNDRVYVRSFDVGLGEFNSTPIGRFRVARDSKLIDPEWRDPRTGQIFSGGAPDNPIGGHWIGLVGDEPHLADAQGYGIHGTIEPDSIGRQASMGCVRMRAEDVALVWGMLMPVVSEVEIID